MLTIRKAHRFLSIVLACCATLVSYDGNAVSDSPTATEVIRLPKFCWGQYNPTLTDPQFTITGCGVGMNHYCPALVYYNRTSNSTNPVARKQYLQRALGDIEYTLGYMKRNAGEFPNCPIKAHVENSYSKVRRDLGLSPLPGQSSPATGSAPSPGRAAADVGVLSPQSGKGQGEPVAKQPTDSKEAPPQRP